VKLVPFPVIFLMVVFRFGKMKREGHDFSRAVKVEKVLRENMGFAQNDNDLALKLRAKS
jgi:hypothetical protein